MEKQRAFEDEGFEEIEVGEVGGPVDSDLLGYNETECERTTVKGCGTFCCVFLGLCVLSWVVHAIPVQSITDTPPFANSLLYLSVAHHTDQWKEAQRIVPPPPPAFGDGGGNFPSA